MRRAAADCGAQLCLGIARAERAEAYRTLAVALERDVCTGADLPAALPQKGEQLVKRLRLSRERGVYVRAQYVAV